MGGGVINGNGIVDMRIDPNNCTKSEDASSNQIDGSVGGIQPDLPMKIYRREKDVIFTFSVDILKVLKHQIDMDELKKKFSKTQYRQHNAYHLQMHSKNSLQLVRNLTQVIKLQINDFSGLSIENMEYFLNELYGSDVSTAESSNQNSDLGESNELALKEKKHNLPEICIEIDMDKLQFRHSRNGPKIFEICGKNSKYSQFVRRLSFITENMEILYSSKVFPQCLNQMSHVKDLSLKVSCVGKKDVCLHLSMCLELEVLNFDFGL